MKMITLILTLLLCNTLFAVELIEHSIQGNKERRINLVFFAEGYTEGEQALFKEDMDRFVDAIFQFEPLSFYENFFNVYGVWAESDQKGLGGFFGSKKWPDVERLIVANNQTVSQQIETLIPETDIPVVIINTKVYGGSGGQIAVASSKHPEIVAHEIGHSFVGLGDEYDYETTGQKPLEMPNITQNRNRETIKWKHWIDDLTPLPTHNSESHNDSVGLFEGAMFKKQGWFRPMSSCQMRSNGVPLCKVCAEQYILTFYDHVSPIDTLLTSNKTLLEVGSNDKITLGVKPMELTGGKSMKIEWFHNNKLKPITDPSISTYLSAGSHVIKVRVTDTTSFVQKDTLGLRSDSATWVVYVNGAAPEECEIVDSTNILENSSFCDGLTHWKSDNKYKGNVIDGQFYITTKEAGAVHDANLNYTLPLDSVKAFTVSFRAKASSEEPILVGLGLNEAPWDNFSKKVTLTTDWTEYSINLAAPVSHSNSRLFFDMGHTAGTVFIDNISLTVNNALNGPELIASATKLDETFVGAATPFQSPSDKSEVSPSITTHEEPRTEQFFSNKVESEPTHDDAEDEEDDEEEKEIEEDDTIEEHEPLLSPLAQSQMPTLSLSPLGLTVIKGHETSLISFLNINGATRHSIKLSRVRTLIDINQLPIPSGHYLVRHGSHTISIKK
ncbi:MAG: M64 family metallo-endopeptidase [Fibrobacterales bacterium]